MVKDYEITYLADPTLDEEGKNKLDEAVDQAISQVEGNILQSGPATGSPGSRRRLHYPINKQKTGWLRVLNVQIESENINDLSADLQKQPGLMRLSILQTAARGDVTPAIFEDKPKTEQPQTDKDTDKKTEKKEVSMEQVEESIEAALDEEVK